MSVSLAVAAGILLAVALTVPVTATEGPTSERRPGQLEDPGQPTFDRGPWATDFGISAVPYSEILSGGVRKDGIPAIDAPVFESIESARAWLSGQSPVIALEIDGGARAYPLAILTWHEIVNDVLAGVPVAVTFCPLCHAALVYERRPDGQVLDFGVSGNLRFSDLVMYDRQTESWWQQATGEGIVGSLTGVVTLGEQDGEAISFPYSELRKSGLAEVDFEGRPVVVFWVPGTVSALDLPAIDESEDVGSTGVFSRLVDGRALSFWRDGGEGAPIRDVETRSTWDVTGRAIDGPLAGTALEPIAHGDHFWFAWAAFVPETSIWTSEGIR